MKARDPFAELEPLVQRVYAYVAYRIGEGEEAEAITSTTFDRALRHRAAFDPRTDEQVPWLIRIARAVLAERALGDRDFIFGAAADNQDTRELIALRYGADLTVPQIARLLDLETVAVDAALHRSVQELAARPAPSM